MAHARSFITEAFLKRIRQSGSLAEAAQRIGASPKAFDPLPKMSTWALVCEEVVDTEYSPAQYERIVAELLRRQISITELEEMRVFVWETAGWLNFEKMVWDWCSLDEEDIQKASSGRLRKAKLIVLRQTSALLIWLAIWKDRTDRPNSRRISHLQS